MDLNPPEGSKIWIANDRGDPTVVVPPASGVGRYLMGFFLLFWLGMWMFGFRDAATKIMSGVTANGFLVFWLAAWTLGGLAAAYAAYRAFRPSVPETLELNRNSVGYDSGIAPPQFDSSWRSRNPANSWSSAFPKRVRLEFERDQLQSLRLRETETGNRLTIDLGNRRHEIAPTASEVEREWLARLLARRYGLPQVFGNATSVKTDAGA
jgi:hypothetical protein